MTRIMCEAAELVVEAASVRQEVAGLLRDLLDRIRRLIDRGHIDVARDEVVNLSEMLDAMWVEDGIVVLDSGLLFGRSAS